MLRFHQILRPNQSFQLFSTLLSYSSNPPLLKDDSKLLLFPVVGRPFANTICMILVIIRMKVLAEKRKELSQTIASLIGSIRTRRVMLSEVSGKLTEHPELEVAGEVKDLKRAVNGRIRN